MRLHRRTPGTTPGGRSGSAGDGSPAVDEAVGEGSDGAVDEAVDEGGAAGPAVVAPKALVDAAPEGRPSATAVDPLVEAVDDVIDARRVRLVFQPVVHLATRERVGYEALVRGPEGSAVESPLALLSAAAAAGRLEELDWLCAVSACSAAKGSGLHPSRSLFLNVEPTTLLTPCPDDLRQVARQAQDQLRVFVELKEESLLDHPRHMLEALGHVREIGWGVAIDGASAGASALALLPLVEPDVVKLDLRLVGPDPAARAAMADGARQYREESGATLLVQGIEETEDALFARVAGADFGQGWHFGRPGPLVADDERPRSVVPLLEAPPTSEDATPFDVVAEEVVPSVAERRLLEPMADHLAGQVTDGGPPALLLASFERTRSLGPAEVDRLDRRSAAAAFAVVLGPALPFGSQPRRQVCRLDADHPMAADWTVLVLGPRHSAALVARDLGDRGPTAFRRFRYAVTHRSSLVAAAARAMLRQAAA